MNGEEDDESEENYEIHSHESDEDLDEDGLPSKCKICD